MVIPEAVKRLLANLRAAVDERLATCVPFRRPEELYGPARYVIDAPGKRFRPLLALLSARLHGASETMALPAATAVELFHNFTLVHDDIMDRAESRRGRATVHVKWDEATAILVGDLLYGLAYAQLSESDPARLPGLLAVFNEVVHALCAGQTLDMVFERQRDVSVDDYLDMIDRKTGALLACALEMGSVVAQAGPEREAAMRALGLDLGRAFQIQDDLLDLTAHDQRWGKPVGGDILEGKRTYLLLAARARASDGSDDARFFDRVLDGSAEESDIPGARDRMEHLGVLDDARGAVAAYSKAAIVRLSEYPESLERFALEALIDRLRSRAH